MPHITRTRVRFPETDKMGVVYHANYFPYFELGRTEMMRDYGLPYTDIEKSGYQLVVIEVHATYLAPAQYDQELDIHTRIAELGGARVVFEYEVTANGTCIAKGTTHHACIGPRGRPVRFPERILKALKSASKGDREADKS